VTIDTSALAPSAPDLATASDSGSSNTDNLTNVTTPTVTGTGAESGATVTLYDTDGMTVLGTTTAAGDGSWSITSSTLSVGLHTLTVKQTDLAGNTSVASASLGVTIDTSALAPSAPDLDPASDTGSSNTDDDTDDTTPTVTGTGAESGATVTLYDTDGTTVLGTATAGGDGSWSITSSDLSAGSHTLTVKQTDLAGNESLASSGLSVTITLPVAPVMLESPLGIDDPGLAPMADDPSGLFGGGGSGDYLELSSDGSGVLRVGFASSPDPANAAGLPGLGGQVPLVGAEWVGGIGGVGIGDAIDPLLSGSDLAGSSLSKLG
jgi:hypothetical protein